MGSVPALFKEDLIRLIKMGVVEYPSGFVLFVLVCCFFFLEYRNINKVSFIPSFCAITSCPTSIKNSVL